MRTRSRIALTAGLLVALAAFAAPRLRSQRLWKRRPPPSVVAVNFTLDRQYDFGPTAGNIPTLPTFAGDPDLVALGTLAPDGGWEWHTDDNGTVAGTPAQNGATFQLTSPWGAGVVTDLSDSTAPVTTGWTAPAGFWKGDMTVIFVGYPTTKQASTETIFTARASGNSGIGVRARFNSGFLQCFWYDTSATATVSGWLNGWSAGACHRSAAGNHVAWAGVDGTPASPSTAFTTETTTSLWVGRDDGASAGAALGGPVSWAALYKANKTAAYISSTIRKATGFPTTTDVTVNGATTFCLEVDGGTAWCSAGLSIMGPLGYRGVKGESAQSKWSSDPLDLTTQLLSPAARVVTNVSGGPLFEWKHTNECDRLESWDGGIASAGCDAGSACNSFIRTGQNYSGAWYVRAGDAGTQRTQFHAECITDGTWTADAGTRVLCDWNDLTAVPTLKHCPCGSLATGTKAYTLISVNDAGQTGSIEVCHGRVNGSRWPEIMLTGNGSVTNSDAEFDAGSNHSHANGGKIEICFAPEINNANSPEWANASDTLYLHDGNAAGGGHLLTDLWGYTILGRHLYLTSKSNGTETDTILDGVPSFTHQQIYCASVEWVPTGGGLCNTVSRWDPWLGPQTLSQFHATTARVSATAAQCPDEWAMAHIPQRYDHSVPVSADVLSYREYYVP